MDIFPGIQSDGICRMDPESSLVSVLFGVDWRWSRQP